MNKMKDVCLYLRHAWNRLVSSTFRRHKSLLLLIGIIPKKDTKQEMTKGKNKFEISMEERKLETRENLLR
jgi:hypothetical protein